MPEQTVEDYLAARRAEWGVYVATEPIDINGARAFNVGDPVPVSAVEGHTAEASYDSNRQLLDPLLVEIGAVTPAYKVGDHVPGHISADQVAKRASKPNAPAARSGKDN